jgi:hypothetical protein
MADFLITLAGSACTLYFAIALARLSRAARASEPRALDAQGRSRVLRMDRRRGFRGRRSLDRRANRAPVEVGDYSSSEADWTTARLRPERLAA